VVFVELVKPIGPPLLADLLAAVRTRDRLEILAAVDQRDVRVDLDLDLVGGGKSRARRDVRGRDRCLIRLVGRIGGVETKGGVRHG
jgi:hypothetical protein